MEKAKEKIKILGSVIGVCISLPIWFYLLYSILTAIDAGELQWFLFWVYIPATVTATLLIRMMEE